MASPPQSTCLSASDLAPRSASRLFLIGGLSLILVGMVWGDIFAVFVLHQNAGRIGRQLLAASRALADGEAGAAGARFQVLGGLLENRGTKVDAHAHMIAFGYLALLLALLQPCVALSPRLKKHLAMTFLCGAWLLPVGVFLIHYIGLTHSPLKSIGWASIAADFGGLLVIAAGIGEIIGMGRGLRHRQPAESLRLEDRSGAGRALLTGGALLVLAGFLHGAWYSGSYLYEHERRDQALLAQMIEDASSHRLDLATQAVNDYGALQAEKAVHIAAHTHIIDFGLLAMLLAFVQPLVYLSEEWKRRWAGVLLAGSVMLPAFVLAELKLGLFAGGIADAGGLLVVIALTAMLVGIIRYTGSLDGGGGGA